MNGITFQDALRCGARMHQKSFMQMPTNKNLLCSEKIVARQMLINAEASTHQDP